jgi:hypothetical protein
LKRSWLFEYSHDRGDAVLAEVSRQVLEHGGRLVAEQKPHGERVRRLLFGGSGAFLKILLGSLGLVTPGEFAKVLRLVQCTNRSW